MHCGLRLGMSLARLGRQLLGLPNGHRSISTRCAVLGLEDFFEVPLKEGQTRSVGEATSRNHVC